MTNLQPFQRHLKLTGCLNLRELGGYKTSDGRQIQWNTLLRSDSLHSLPSSTQQQLLDYGVKTIIDLRSTFEIEKAEIYDLKNSSEIIFLNLPLIEENNSNIIESIKDKTLFELNCFLLEKQSLKIKTILETIATQPTPVIIHCAIGKDRTGIIIALLLAIADVPITTIAEDYHLSDRFLSSFYDTIRPRAIQEGFTHLLESSPQTIMDTFAYLDRNYGGFSNYLAHIGIDSATKDRIKTKLTT